MADMIEQPKKKSLMDALRPQLEGQAEPVELGQTEQAQSLLRTKLSGKSIQPSTQPKAGGMAERQAALATQQAGREQQLKGRLQGQQLEQQEAGQQQQFEEQRANLTDRWEDAQAIAKRQTDAILQDFEQGKKRLGDQEANAAAEQAAFLIRFQNKDYITKLNQEGQQSRLENDIEFKTKAMEQAFADEQGLLRDSLSAKRLADMDQRTWDRELANMDVNYILDQHRQNMKAQKQRGIFQGIGNVVGAGASAYGSGAFSGGSGGTAGGTGGTGGQP